MKELCRHDCLNCQFDDCINDEITDRELYDIDSRDNPDYWRKKEKNKAYHKEYYLKHKERIDAQNKRYAEENREKVLAMKREWARKHRKHKADNL